MTSKFDKTAARLREVAGTFAPAAFATSLGAEDMVLLDLIDRNGFEIEVFTLDTGRLPEETHDLLQMARQRYKTPIRVFTPESADVEGYTRAHGPNGFYESVELRQECCQLRKVRPLRRALQGKRAWLTGLRREQSPTRRDLPFREWDAANGLEKFNPLADWLVDEVWDYIRQHEVPYSALHKRGYPSIGCAPCTRAIGADEDIRAGRWWWENPENKECGLHPRQRSHG